MVKSLSLREARESGKLGHFVRQRKGEQVSRNAGINGQSVNACNQQPGTIFYDDWLDGHDEGLRLAGAAALRAEGENG